METLNDGGRSRRAGATTWTGGAGGDDAASPTARVPPLGDLRSDLDDREPHGAERYLAGRGAESDHGSAAGDARAGSRLREGNQLDFPEPGVRRRGVGD